MQWLSTHVEIFVLIQSKATKSNKHNMRCDIYLKQMWQLPEINFREYFF